MREPALGLSGWRYARGLAPLVPEEGGGLKEPYVKEEKFEDVVKSAQDAAVLVLVY